MTALDLRTLDVHDDSPAHRELLLGWMEATYRGFLQARTSEHAQRLLLEHARVDDMVLRGAWLPEGRFGAGAVPVATYSSWDGEVNTGGASLRTRLVSDVTVSPAHRRQGLLRRMMLVDLEDAASTGVPLAALTASEGRIYGRFGFGPAVWERQVEVDPARFRVLPHAAVPEGGMAMVDPRECGDLFVDLFARWHAGTRGTVGRPSMYGAVVSGLWDREGLAPDDRLRAAVHLDADEKPDGYVLWTHQGWERPRTVTVRDLVGTSPQVERELWRFVTSMDLTDRVKGRAPVDDPLLWALADPDAYQVTGQGDQLWLRVLDVPAALTARPWYADGEVVLEVADELGYADGRWRLAVHGGSAELTPVVAAGAGAGAGAGVAVRMDAVTLASLYLGGVGVPTLVTAGRITGPAEELTRFARMADGGPVPVSRTDF